MARAISQIAANFDSATGRTSIDSQQLRLLPYRCLARVNGALAIRFLPVRVGPTSQLGVGFRAGVRA